MQTYQSRNSVDVSGKLDKGAFTGTANDLENNFNLYAVSEVLTANGGKNIRVFNGSAEKYIGTLPFICADFESEKAELPSRWETLFSTYPSPYNVTITPSSVLPNSIDKWLLVKGDNLSNCVYNLGSNYTIKEIVQNSVHENRIRVDTNGTISSFSPTVNNGKVITLPISQQISLGELIIPESIGFPFINTSVDIIKRLGGLESVTTATNQWGGTFSDGIPIANDFELSFTKSISIVDPILSGWHLGFVNTNSSTSLLEFMYGTTALDSISSFEALPIDKFVVRDGVKVATFFNQGDNLKIRRTKLTLNTCEITYFVNDEQLVINTGALDNWVKSNLDVNDIWFPAFRFYNLNKLENIQLIIL